MGSTSTVPESRLHLSPPLGQPGLEIRALENFCARAAAKSPAPRVVE